MSRNLQDNDRAMHAALGTSVDLIYREFTCGHRGPRKGILVFVDGLAEGKAVQDLLEAAVRFTNPPFAQPRALGDPVLDFKETVVHAIELRTSRKLADAVESVLAGETALFLDGGEHVLLADTRWNPSRAPDEPVAETEVRGPRDGMVENIRINTVLVRRRIRDPRLRVEALQMGRRTRTDVALLYIEGLADPGVVQEVRRRLERVQIDGIYATGQIEELIADNPLSPFPTTLSTERPDRAAAALLEGRVCIMVDNTPFALLVPGNLWQQLQAPGDYYNNYWAGSALRLLRFGSLLMALVMPSLFTILTTFHHEMLPTPLALTIAGGREGRPLPSVGEVLLLETMFEVMQEAGLRLPRAVGQTVSIVGALVIGEAAVAAGIISPATVIVIATTGISGFAIPVFATSLTIRLLRFPLLLLSGALGVFGFLAGTSILALYLASLRSFGAPFTAPVAPLQVPEQRDTLIRLPWWKMTRLPRLGREQRTRRQPNQMPRPPRHGGGGGP